MGSRPDRAEAGFSPRDRAELLHVLMLPDFDRVNRIGSYWGNPATRTFAELLIGKSALNRNQATIGSAPIPVDS